MYPVYIKRFIQIFVIFSLVMLGFFLYSDVSPVQAPAVTGAASSSTSAAASTPVQKESEALAPIEEGKQYRRLSIAITHNPKIQEFIARDPGKIQLIEFFSYGCFGCQQLHAVINQWVKDKGSPANPMPVVFYRMPLIFHPTWETLAKAYYTVKMLGLSEQLDSEFFTAVNQHHVTFNPEDTLEDFVKMRGVDPQLFMDTYRSFGVNRQLMQDAEISRLYQVGVSPYFVLNTPAGSFVTSAVMAGSNEGLLNVLNYLITLKPSS